MFTVGDINEPGARFVADDITASLPSSWCATPWASPTSRWTCRTSTPGARWPMPPTPSSRAGSSWPATRPTRCRRPAASAATPASRTPTTWRGSWRWYQGAGWCCARRHLRRRAPARRGAGRRAGLQPLRAPLRSRPRHRGHARGRARHARGVQPLPLERRAPRPRRRRRRRARHRPSPVACPARHAGAARGAPPRRREPLDARPLRSRLRAPDRTRRRRVASACPARRCRSRARPGHLRHRAGRGRRRPGRTRRRRGDLLHDRLWHRSLRRGAGAAGRVRRLAPAAVGSGPDRAAHGRPRRGAVPRHRRPRRTRRRARRGIVRPKTARRGTTRLTIEGRSRGGAP